MDAIVPLAFSDFCSSSNLTRLVISVVLLTTPWDVLFRLVDFFQEIFEGHILASLEASHLSDGC